MKIVVFLVCVSLFCTARVSACDGTPNTLPVWTDAPELVTSVPNGKLFVTGSPDLGARLLVAHVYGTPYEMGYAQGLLLKTEIPQIYTEMLDWIYNSVDEYLPKLPKYVQEIIAQDGVAVALQATYDLTKPFIPQYYTDEVQGIADALNQTFDDVMRINLFPELIQASCSMMGAWGESIKDTNGTLYQLRALDWDTTSPLQQYPVYMVYHPSESGHTFSILTWPGFIGALTGYSSVGVGVSEKVWDAYPGKQNRAGMPWMFVLRDILQFDQDVDDAISRLASAPRTCAIFVGVGDDNANYNAIEYSYEILQVFDDSNMPNHTQFTDVVYVDKHVQPSSDPCMPDLIDQYYGKVDATTIFQQITSQFQTGDMHIAVFDYAERLAYISNASPFVNNTSVSAYDRPFTRLSLNDLFAEPAPESFSERV